jgi:peroxiredoxin/YHS domain-containing protein
MKWLLRTLLLVAFCFAPALADAAEKALCPVCVTLEGASAPETVHAWRTYEGTRYGLCSKECAKKFDAEPAAYIPRSLPRPAPPFSATGFDGKAIDLSTYAGKVVLLDYWATWCGPCRRSMPELERLHQEYSRKGLIVLGVSVDDPPAHKKARDLVKSKRYAYHFAFDRTDKPSWPDWGVQAIPAAFLIDRKGQIVAQWTGLPADPAEIENAIREIL